MDSSAIAELATALARHGRLGHGVSALDGLAAALAIGRSTERLPPALRALLGRMPRAPLPDGLDASSKQWCRGVDTALADGRYAPWLIPSDGAAPASARGWCAGFALGVDVIGEAWIACVNRDPQRIAMLDPVLRLAAADGAIAFERDPTVPPQSAIDYRNALVALGPAVIALYRAWRAQPE